MTESDLARELARRTDVAHADAAKILAALGELAGEHAEAGLPLPVAGLHAATPTAGPARATVAGARREFPGDRSDAVADTADEDRTPYVPGRRDIDDLIAAARQHPQGLEFLLDGDLGAVAVTFQAHAFTVEAARHEVGRQRS